MINWSGTKEEYELIGKIVKRAKREKLDLPDLCMDIAAVHLNGNPLDLDGLLEAERFDFAHDVCGIHRHIHHGTGKLMHCFSPRHSKRDQAKAAPAKARP